MGLDMYCYVVKSEDAVSDFEIAAGAEKNEIRYWRKHNALHRWMEKLYEKKGGTDTFNCKPLRLTLEDLQQLKTDVKPRELKSADGFFWGSSYEYDEEYMKDDLKFVYDAMYELDCGNAVYYDSWW